MKTIQNSATTNRTFRSPLLALRVWIPGAMCSKCYSGHNPETQWLPVVYLLFQDNYLGETKDAQSHPEKELSCLNSSCFKHGLIQDLECEWSKGEKIKGCSYRGTRKSTTQRNLSKDWLISGFGSWRWYFRQNFYKLTSIQMGTGECFGKISSDK